jgi:hypothetical protein
MSDYDIFKGYGVPVTLNAPDNFLKIKETLTRIGIASRKDNTLYQSCHILHKQGFYVILHFKELFALDGKPADISDEDLQRRNSIARLLSEWDLLEIVQKEPATCLPLNRFKIISFKDKPQWKLVSKYNIGKKKA